MDTVFKALADPTRREILRLLGQSAPGAPGGGEMTAGQLAQSFDISGPSMSHHFNVLKSADLISARRDGQQILYALNTTVFQDVLAMLFEVFGHEAQPDANGAPANSHKEKENGQKKNGGKR